MRKLFYVGLEKYKARYTYQLQEWNERVFKAQKLNYIIVEGELLSNSKEIKTGSVLDVHTRNYYALTQVAKLVAHMQRKEITSEDVIFFEDMYTPGIEALAYICALSDKKYRPKIWVRCLAQTIDPDDFVNREGMFNWMRHFELMQDNFISGILVASEEMVSYLRVAGFKSKIYVTGLPFGKQEVLDRVKDKKIKALGLKKNRVAFAARWDAEKQPEFFMRMAKKYFKIDPKVEFAIFTGNSELRGNNKKWVKEAVELSKSNKANFKIYTNLSKNKYYELLADSKVLFNCALQDWVSNTISEADTLGVMTLFPAYRSFPEAVFNNRNHLYTPWSIEDALDKLYGILVSDEEDEIFNSIGKISDNQDKTIYKTVQILKGDKKALRLYGRNGLDYRKNITPKK